MRETVGLFQKRKREDEAEETESGEKGEEKERIVNSTVHQIVRGKECQVRDTLTP